MKRSLQECTTPSYNDLRQMLFETRFDDFEAEIKANPPLLFSTDPDTGNTLLLECLLNKDQQTHEKPYLFVLYYLLYFYKKVLTETSRAMILSQAVTTINSHGQNFLAVLNTVTDDETLFIISPYIIRSLFLQLDQTTRDHMIQLATAKEDCYVNARRQWLQHHTWLINTIEHRRKSE